MALRLIVNGRDLTEFNRMAHGDGHEPASADAFDPQFTGSTAIGEGQSFVGNSLGNVAMSFPLILKAASTDALYQLIRDIRTDLVKGNTVEYRSGGASQSTFFDMESGKLEPNFEFWLDQNARCRAQLTIWRRPYGHTGTMRLLASSVGTSMQTFTVGTSVGDIPGDLRITSIVPSVGQPNMIYGVKSPVPSGWAPEWRGASIVSANPGYFGTGTQLAIPTVMGASGRLASQAWGVRMPFLGPIDYNYDGYIPVGRVNLPRPMFGRHRLFAGVRGNWTTAASGNALRVKLDQKGITEIITADWGGVLSEQGRYPFPFVGETFRFTTANSNQWRLVDFGEINIPTGAATPFLVLMFRGASGMAAGASVPLQIDGFRFLPLDNPAGLHIGESVSNRATQIVQVEGSTRSAQTTLGVAQLSTTHRVRGDFPKLPVGATAQITVMPYKENDDLQANLPVGVSIELRERFSYMR